MKFTVAWDELSLKQLAHAWVEHDDRVAINRDVDTIDRELKHDPMGKGDDYFGDRYVLLPVLWALFSVNPDDRVVRVLQVGRIGFDLPHDELPEE